MQQWKGTIVAIVILALLGGYVGYFVWGGHSVKKATPTPAPEPILHNVNFSDVDGVLIAGKDKLLSLHRNKDGKWEMLAPKPGPADDERVNRVLSYLIDARPKRVITDTLDIKGFGLKNPAWHITLREKDNTVTTLNVGEKNPDGTFYYVQLDKEKDKIYMMSAIVVSDVTDMVTSPPYQRPTPAPTPTPSS